MNINGIEANFCFQGIQGKKTKKTKQKTKQNKKQTCVYDQNSTNFELFHNSIPFLSILETILN